MSCQRLEASGSIQVLADAACEEMSRPEHREPCVSEACAEWMCGPWGQVDLISLTHFKALLYFFKEKLFLKGFMVLAMQLDSTWNIL